MITRSRLTRTDDGFTLVELLAYMIILVIVMGMGAAIFIQIIQNQQAVKASAEANNTAQLVFRELERDLRNAAWVTVADGGDLAVMRTRSATPGDEERFVCVGYFLDTASGELRRTVSAGSTFTAPALTATASTLPTVTANWHVARDGMARLGAARVFGVVDQTYESPDAIDLRLRAQTVEGRPPVELTKTVSMRPQALAGIGCN